MKKQGKQQYVYTNASAVPVDNLPVPPPNYFPPHEGAYEMEKEVLKETKEEGGKDIKREDEESLITAEDNPCNDTEM